MRLFQRLMGFVLRVFSLKNFRSLIDRIKTNRDGLRHKFFQPSFLSIVCERSLTNLAPKILNKLKIKHLNKESITANQHLTNFSLYVNFRPTDEPANRFVIYESKFRWSFRPSASYLNFIYYPRENFVPYTTWRANECQWNKKDGGEKIEMEPSFCRVYCTSTEFVAEPYPYRT